MHFRHLKKIYTFSLSIFLTINCYTVNAQILGGKIALSQLVYTIRDPQTDRKHFRECLEKIGEYLAVEVLQDLATTEKQVETPTGVVATHSVCSEEPVLITILRGGIPLLTGVQHIFSHSEVGFLGMARNEETLQAKTDYIAIPYLKDKSVIIADTMIGTGGSVLDAIKIIQVHQPKEIIVVCAIASQFGMDRIREHNPGIKIYAAAIDPLLNHKGFIVPGLGDAGDRAYGEKQ